MSNELKYDKNAKEITIPYGTTCIPDGAFKDFTELESINIPNTVTEIGEQAFQGCTALKRIILPSSLLFLHDCAFSNCSSLKEITLPPSLHYISYGLFSHCHNLKKVTLHDDINYIDDHAFYHCKSLKSFTIPESTTSLGRMALMGCEKIKSIHIPKKVNCIEEGALSFMSSLEQITIDKENPNFFTENDNTVLLAKDGTILQYAINCDQEEFIVGYYEQDHGTITEDNGTTIPLISNELVYNIANYAFAGAKKLKKIYFPSEIETIGPYTFQDCDNLRTLEVFKSLYGDAFLLRINSLSNEFGTMPFETINFEDGIKVLCDNLANLLVNARTIKLPNDLESISKNVLSKSSKLKSLTIPANIKAISPETFHPDTLLTFPNFGTIKAGDFNMLQTKTSNDYYAQITGRDNIRIFSLKDGTYYVKIDNHGPVEISKDEILALSKSSNLFLDKPDELILYLFNLFTINHEQEKQISYLWMDPKLNEIFKKFAIDSECVNNLASQKITNAIREVIEASGIYDEFLFSSLLMNRLTKEEIKKILDNYSESLSRFFRFASRLNPKPLTNIDNVIVYCSLLKKYQVYDRFLYNTLFVDKLSPDLQELLIKKFNKNIKKLIINSKTLTDNCGVNLSDLINLCIALGVFDENQTFSQKMTTFLNEIMFDSNREFPVVGNIIHTIFGEINPRSETDYEFISFFIENYKELLKVEQTNSGMIARIYNNFRKISSTSTSHRGSQRHLKVTLDKCLNYFISSKFENVTEKNKRLAYFLQSFYSEPFVLTLAEQMTTQSEAAPRNIFSKIDYDEFGNPTYSHNPNEDLRETSDTTFSYEWLPKQDYDNLVLGKYCSCCAHLLGAGAGIMHASMTLDNVQNLVIRNTKGEIIAKMTLYVNRDQGYAVFNTAEVNILYQPGYFIEQIYKAFERGVNAFIKKYNENNSIPIKIITMGEYRNQIKYNLGNIQTEVLETPNYSEYGYNINGQTYGTYNGDSKSKQILVYKK